MIPKTKMMMQVQSYDRREESNSTIERRHGIEDQRQGNCIGAKDKKAECRKEARGRDEQSKILCKR